MRGTRADLHQNGLKWFRNSFLTSVFEHGADLDKTQKVSSRFLPLSAKLYVQKRRMAFSGIYAGKNGIKAVVGKVFSMYFRINWKNSMILRVWDTRDARGEVSSRKNGERASFCFYADAPLVLCHVFLFRRASPCFLRISFAR